MGNDGRSDEHRRRISGIASTPRGADVGVCAGALPRRHSDAARARRAAQPALP
jgi:hypothetical protein